MFIVKIVRERGHYVSYRIAEVHSVELEVFTDKDVIVQTDDNPDPHPADGFVHIHRTNGSMETIPISKDSDRPDNPNSLTVLTPEGVQVAFYSI